MYNYFIFIWYDRQKLTMAMSTYKNWIVFSPDFNILVDNGQNIHTAKDDPAEFLTLFSKSLARHGAKFESAGEILAAPRVHLKEAGLPVRARRWILSRCGELRRGEHDDPQRLAMPKQREL
jgi:hypothetical protein